MFNELPAQVTINEVGPRDGLQNETKVISTEDKSHFINLLIDAGLKNIEVRLLLLIYLLNLVQ